MADPSLKECADAKKTPFMATFSWALYDFANTIYSMNVVTMYFAQWVVVDLGLEDIFYGAAFSASMVLVAVTVPVLGAAADASGRRLTFLLWFTIGTCVFTAGLAVPASMRSVTVAGAVGLALFCLANYFYGGSLAFYNALLPAVSTPANVGRVSGAGVAFGYAGTIFGLVMVLPFVEGWVPGFGSGRPAAFVPTALLFALFALPTFIWVRELKTRTERSALTR